MSTTAWEVIIGLSLLVIVLVVLFEFVLKRRRHEESSSQLGANLHPTAESAPLSQLQAIDQSESDEAIDETDEQTEEERDDATEEESDMTHQQ
jgi:CBS-domain-containing membrane protein